MNAEYRQRFAAIDWTPLPQLQTAPQQQPARADLACPMFISDAMPPTEHVDGKFYESKSAFRAITKARGYVEIGNDPARFNKPVRHKADRKAIKEAVAKAVAQHS